MAAPGVGTPPAGGTGGAPRVVVFLGVVPLARAQGSVQPIEPDVCHSTCNWPASHRSVVPSSHGGSLTPAQLCLMGFLDFTGTTIVNVALPPIRAHPGFPMPGGRAADLL